LQNCKCKLQVLLGSLRALYSDPFGYFIVHTLLEICVKIWTSFFRRSYLHRSKWLSDTSLSPGFQTSVLDPFCVKNAFVKNLQSFAPLEAPFNFVVIRKVIELRKHDMRFVCRSLQSFSLFFSEFTNGVWNRKASFSPAVGVELRIVPHHRVHSRLDLEPQHRREC
jgi:hypothetical protein